MCLFSRVPCAAETHSLQTLHTILSTGSPLKPQSYEYVYRCIKNNVLLGSISGELTCACTHTLLAGVRLRYLRVHTRSSLGPGASPRCLWGLSFGGPPGLGKGKGRMWARPPKADIPRSGLYSALGINLSLWI